MMDAFELIDRLAGWWLDWRMDQAIKHSPEAQALEMHKFKADKNGIEIVAIAPDIPILADQAAALLRKFGAENFVQWDMMPRLDHSMDLRPIRVTVAWANGELPATKCARLEAELKALKNQGGES